VQSVYIIGSWKTWKKKLTLFILCDKGNKSRHPEPDENYTGFHEEETKHRIMKVIEFQY
jgi:hypothetical protein